LLDVLCDSVLRDLQFNDLIQQVCSETDAILIFVPV
jgi:hypothetical protein